MEENTNTQQPVITNAEHTNVMPVNTVTKHKFNKKTVIVLIIVVIFAGLGIGYYFYMKKDIEPYIPTLEEKVNAVEETVNKTKELGLPPIKKQVEIMNYNLQN